MQITAINKLLSCGNRLLVIIIIIIIALPTKP
jgi:hypothetical protein